MKILSTIDICRLSYEERKELCIKHNIVVNLDSYLDVTIALNKFYRNLE